MTDTNLPIERKTWFDLSAPRSKPWSYPPLLAGLKDYLVKELYDMGVRDATIEYNHRYNSQNQPPDRQFHMCMWFTNTMYRRSVTKTLRDAVLVAGTRFVGYPCSEDTILIRSLEKQPHELDLVEKRIEHITYHLTEIQNTPNCEVEVHEILTEVGALQADPEVAGIHLAKKEVIELRSRRDVAQEEANCCRTTGEWWSGEASSQFQNEATHLEAKIWRLCERYNLPHEKKNKQAAPAIPSVNDIE